MFNRICIQLASVQRVMARFRLRVVLAGERLSDELLPEDTNLKLLGGTKHQYFLPRRSWQAMEILTHGCAQAWLYARRTLQQTCAIGGYAPQPDGPMIASMLSGAT